MNLLTNQTGSYPKNKHKLKYLLERIAQLEAKNIELENKLIKLNTKFNLVFDQKYSAYSLDTITMAACDFFHVEQHQIKKKTRKREIVLARQACMQIAYRKSKLSLKEIGEYFDRDHSTVIHSIKVIESNYLTGNDEKSFEFMHMYMPFENFLEELDIFYRKKGICKD